MRRTQALIVIMAALGTATLLRFTYYPKWAFESYVSQHRSEYLATANLNEPHGLPYIAGRIVVFDTGDLVEEGSVSERVDTVRYPGPPRDGRFRSRPGQLSQLFDSIPADLKAARPNQIRTVVLLDWRAVRWAPWVPTHAAAYRSTCEVIVIDRSVHAIVARRSFEGYDPPTMMFAGATHVWGMAPTDEIVAFLVGLPRR